jgi:hypothetical protein
VTDGTPTLGQALEAALDVAASKAGDATGLIEAASGHARVEAEVVDVDRLGVIVERVRVTTGPGDLAQRAKRVVERVRPDGQRMRTVEVDNRLGGGILRTAPVETGGGRFYQIDLDENGGILTRHRKDESGRRQQERFTMTREGLGRLVDDLSQALDD